MFSFMKKNKVKALKAFLSGDVIPIDQVKDEVFASKSMGDGIAIIPTNNRVLSPADSEVILIMEETKHAICLKLSNNMEIMIHVGIDTVNLKGSCFNLLVKKGDKVKEGQPLILFDTDKIQKQGYDITTMLVILNEGKASNINFKTGFIAESAKDIVVSFE